MYILDTWSLTLDIWHWYLTWYYLAPDTWHLISDTGTWHAITWHLIPVLDMLSLDTWYLTPDNWHAITWYLTYAITWYWHIWPDIVIPDWILLYLTPVLPCIFMIITLRETWHDYYIVTRYLVLLNSCAPESCILEPLKQGDSWYYTPNIILMLIPVIG